MLIAVDVDGVVLDTHSEVLRRYNIDYGDNLGLDDIQVWDMSRFAKPECGAKILGYFENPEVYKFAYHIVGALAGVRALRDAHHRVVYATTPARNTAGVKLEVLTALGFLDYPEDYIECTDKNLVRADVLIDDYAPNVNLFQGKRILFDRPWNANSIVYYGVLRARDWKQVVGLINGFES